MTYFTSRRPVAAAVPAAEAGRILEAVQYLEQCRQHARRFAVLAGEDKGAIRTAIDDFLSGLPQGCRIARTPAPTDSSHAFLEAVLAQLGFEPFESTADDLHRLLTVVLRQDAGREASTVIIVEDAQDFGPRVLETIRDLARNSRESAPAPLLVLAGHAGLNRVLDSKGMASVAGLTRLRFDMSGRSTADVGAPADAPYGTLELSLNRDVIGRFPLLRERVLIGRGQHSDICIASRFVSRHHALIVRNADGEWLIDLNSTNGTCVNSQRIKHRLLQHGDVISLGNHRLRYARPDSRRLPVPAGATRDQLSETLVMRSIRGLHAPDPEPATADSAPTAA